MAPWGEAGPGRCDLCGSRVPFRHPFLVRVRTRGWTDVAAACCEACSRYLDAAKTRRLQAIGAVVLGAMVFAPLYAVADLVLGGRTGSIVAVGFVAVWIGAMVLRARRWDAPLRARWGKTLLDDLARALPDAPAVLAPRDVRIVPSMPRDASPRVTLDELRARGKRVRELPN